MDYGEDEGSVGLFVLPLWKSERRNSWRTGIIRDAGGGKIQPKDRSLLL